jgi:hypothetical protein
MAGMVFAEAFQGVQPAESDGGLVMAELFNGLTVQVGDPAFSGIMDVVACDPFSAFAGYLLDALATVGGHEGN